MLQLCQKSLLRLQVLTVFFIDKSIDCIYNELLNCTKPKKKKLKKKTIMSSLHHKL